jgi:REP element-mobilizing transposase RayT
MNPIQEPPYHSKDLRKGRVSELSHVYLITTITYQRKPLFQDWKTGRLVVRELRDATELGLVDSLAWVIMPDHLHWLIQLQDTPLHLLMQRVKSRSAIAVNSYLGTAGQLWQKGYHDHAVRREEDVQALARYVVANPLRAGLVSKIDDYPLWDAIWL